MDARVRARARGLGPAPAPAHEVAIIVGAVVAGAELAIAATTREAVGLLAEMKGAGMIRAEMTREKTRAGATSLERAIAAVRLQRNPDTRTTPKLPAARTRKAMKRRRENQRRKENLPRWLIAKIAMRTATMYRPRLKAEVTMLRDKQGETKIVKKIKTARAVGIDPWRGTTTDVASVTRTAEETTDEIARVTAIG